ncbi:putative RNA-directed DNA polymerase, eukaryota, reverse transcriptase zinc-binding domain protein [Tanacetum coccineum]
MIHGIMKEGAWIPDPSQIKEEFLNFFKEKFKNHYSNMDFPPFTNSSKLCSLDHDSLETPISLDEVKNAIRACLSSSRALVLVNGSPTSECSIKHGLRQGDHLLPFIFILVMEGFYNAHSTVVSSGLIRGVKFGSPELTISYLFYVDDMIITTEWNANDLDNMIHVLQVFYLASGLKINIRKSNVYVIGVLDVDVSSMASNFRCASGSFPFTCLRLPIGSNMSLTLSWQVPESVLNFLERSRAILKAFNLALLQKRPWRLLSHKNALLVKVIKALHGQEVGFENNDFPFVSKRVVARKDCLIINRIDHGQWRWNWSRPNLRAQNLADLLDMLFEISSAEIHKVEDTCVWSLGTDGTFSIKDA